MTGERSLIDERLRDRLIDVIEILADGNDAVKRFGFIGYFNLFFDYFPEDRDFVPLSTMSKDETAATIAVLGQMLSAVEATPQNMTDDEFIATGWPGLIQPIAKQAVETFLITGRCAGE
jgi:hypothetical protein